MRALALLFFTMALAAQTTIPAATGSGEQMEGYQQSDGVLWGQSCEFSLPWVDYGTGNPTWYTPSSWQSVTTVSAAATTTSSTSTCGVDKSLSHYIATFPTGSIGSATILSATLHFYAQAKRTPAWDYQGYTLTLIRETTMQPAAMRSCQSYSGSGGIALTSINAPAWNTINISSPNTVIQKTGPTYLLLYVSGCPEPEYLPPGNQTVRAAAVDMIRGTHANRPYLVITLAGSRPRLIVVTEGE